MLKPTGLERAAVRAAFNEQRSERAHADFLFREVERRMMERLDLIRLEPVQRVLDVGCGSGHSMATLAVRYPQAQLIGADLADRSLAESAGKPARQKGLQEGARRWLSRMGVASARELPATRPLWIAADAHALAIGSNTIDMVWSNVAAHWFDDPLAAVAEWHRVIRPEGLLMFSAFGVDTLKEVRPSSPGALSDRAGQAGQALSAAAPAVIKASEAVGAPTTGKGLSWPTYQDMHDWGDALSAAGFADPVMDVEHLTLTYEDEIKYWKDVRSLSMMRNLGDDTAVPGFGGRGIRASGPLSLSIEVIYGHAWCPRVKRRSDGLATVQFHASGASYNRER
jgi:malonyl-CoA O-methyltransferase